MARQPIRKKKKIPTLTIYVTFSIAIVLIYTVIEKVIAVKYGIQNDTLTTCVYGFFGGEVVTCGLMKIFKIWKGGNE